MELIKGNSAKIIGTVYLDSDMLSLAPLIGASVKVYVKRRATDLDADALINKAGAVTSTTLSTYEAVITAAETNALMYNKVFAEVVIKLNSGDYIRTGIIELVLAENVGKTLF
jgi:hypothetical protein